MGFGWRNLFGGGENLLKETRCLLLKKAKFGNWELGNLLEAVKFNNPPQISFERIAFLMMGCGGFVWVWYVFTWNLR
jgi:hypothetical protein